MIKLTQSTSNTVVVTLTENVSISNPKFLFEFENQQTKEKYYCIATDTSSYTERYNQFTIIEKTNPTPTAGEVRLAKQGLYNYIVYQQSSSSNLDPDNTSGIVEKGIARIYGTASTTYSHTPTAETYVAYNP